MRTHRPLTGLELMVDEATGHRRSSNVVPIYVSTLCPSCKKRAQFPAEAWMSDGTALIEVECATCDPTLSGRAVKLLDASGAVLAE